MGDDQTYFQNFSLPRGFKALPSTSLVALKEGKNREIRRMLAKLEHKVE